MHVHRSLSSASGEGERVMPAHRWMLSVLVALVLWAAAAHSQPPALINAYNRVSELYAQDRHQEALPFAEKALRLGEREFGPNDPATAATLNNVALIYTVLWPYSKAGPYYRRALSAMNHFGQGQSLFRGVVPFIFEA